MIARLRQIQAADRNALAIYTELSRLVKDDARRKVFFEMAEDEKRHVILGKEMLLLLEK